MIDERASWHASLKIFTQSCLGAVALVDVGRMPVPGTRRRWRQQATLRNIPEGRSHE